MPELPEVKERSKKTYLITFLGIFLLMYIGIGMISNLILKIVVGEESTNQIIVENLPMVFKIVSGIFLAPILEEIVFRGLLKKVIKNKVVFIIISSLIFGTMHIVPNLINPIQLLYLVPYVLAGVELGFIYAKTDNIFTSITLHMFSNALGILLA